MDFYIDNLDEVMENYKDKFLLISQGKILSVCNTFTDGCLTAKQQGLAVAEYIILPCIPESPLGILANKIS